MSSHTPQRTCTGCREVAAQADLVRVVWADARLVTGRGPGRGAYVHARSSCLDAARRGGLARSFRRAIPPQVLQGLAIEMSPTVDNPPEKPAGHVTPEAVERPPRTSGKG